MAENDNIGNETKSQTKVTSKPQLYQTVKDTVSLELTRPVITRLRQRLKQLKDLTQAKHEKQMIGSVAVFHTTPPKMFISGLNATLNSNIGVITYNKYKKDGENKKLKVTQLKSPYSDKMVDVEASYELDCLVVETIERFKPIKIEEVRM